MDLAWVAAIMRAPVVTPPDPWFAGGTLDIYYYLGHWLMAQLGLLAGVPARVVFNLVLPTVMAVSAVNCYLIGHLLLERYRWLPIGLLVLVNPTAIVQLAIGQGAHPGSRPLPPRDPVRPDRYPLFSMILGDPHALVMGMINQLFLIALLAFAWTRWSGLSSRQRWALMGLSALSLGAMPGINSWDVLVYAPLVVVMGLLLWWRTQGGGRPRCAAGPALLDRRPRRRARPVPPLPARDPARLGPRRAAGPGALRAGLVPADLGILLRRDRGRDRPAAAAAAVPAPGRRPVRLPGLLLGRRSRRSCSSTCWSAGRAASRT